MFATALLAFAATTANAGISIDGELELATKSAGLEVARSFDGYTDAAALGQDALPSSMKFVDGLFFTDDDGVTQAVLEVDYLEGVWIVLGEDSCRGTYGEGCLSGYVIHSIMVVDEVQERADQTHLRANVYVNDEGMKLLGSMDVSATELSDGSPWLEADIYNDANTLVVSVDSDDANESGPLAYGDDYTHKAAVALWGAVVGMVVSGGNPAGASAGGMIATAVCDLFHGDDEGDEGDDGASEDGKKEDDEGAS